MMRIDFRQVVEDPRLALLPYSDPLQASMAQTPRSRDRTLQLSP